AGRQTAEPNGSRSSSLAIRSTRVAGPCLYLQFFVPVVASVVVVVVPVVTQINIVQHHAKYLCSDPKQFLTRSTHKIARALSTVNNEDHSLDHSRQDHRIGHVH